MIDYASIGFKVKEARKKKRITQEQLAEAVGVLYHIKELFYHAFQFWTVGRQIDDFNAMLRYLGKGITFIFAAHISYKHPRQFIGIPFLRLDKNAVFAAPFLFYRK